MKVDLFDFDLPPACIAQQPASPRDSAKLLHVADTLSDAHVRDLPDMLDANDVLVLNNTKVIPTRLKGKRGEAKIEVTLHKHAGPGIWRAFAKPARRLKPGQTIDFAADFSAEVTAKFEGEVTLDFGVDDGALIALLETHGAMPLPPYIKRAEKNLLDNDNYQTVFAEKDGAVAAPTAGLHFTPALLDQVRAKGVEIVFVTLHVGAGTFLPVKSDDVKDHVMHAEWGEITPKDAERLTTARGAGKRIVAVGTTSLRILETAAKEEGVIEAFTGETSIFITPGYRFKAVDRLLTNFHLPRSTLFMLVSAFVGLERMQEAYAHAIANGYRFYSYGDGSLLERNDR